MEMMRGEVDNHGNRLNNKSLNSWYPEQEAIADLALWCHSNVQDHS